MNTDTPDLIIVGGGLRGTLLAMAIAERRPDVDCLVIEQTRQLGGGAIDPYFVDEVSAMGQRLLDDAVVAEWDDYYVSLAGPSRRVHRRSVAVVPEQIHAEALDRLSPDKVLLGCKVSGISDRTVATPLGILRAKNVIDLTGRPSSTGPGMWCSSATFDLPERQPLFSPILADMSVQTAPHQAFGQYLPLSPVAITIRSIALAQSPVPAMPTLLGAQPRHSRRLVYPLRVPSAGVPQRPADPILPSHVYDAAALAEAIVTSPLNVPLEMSRFLQELRMDWAKRWAHRTELLEDWHRAEWPRGPAMDKSRADHIDRLCN